MSTPAVLDPEAFLVMFHWYSQGWNRYFKAKTNFLHYFGTVRIVSKTSTWFFLL